MSTPPVRRRPIRTGLPTGFSLIDLLLALSLGISLSGLILQLLISESQLGLRVNRLLRERSVQQRSLGLIRDDVQRSSRISATPQLEQHACSMAGRLAVLHLTTTAGAITYSVGAAPSPIWRGQVLMRCGPAFDLEGQPSLGSTAQNRVVIDGLGSQAAPPKICDTLINPSGSRAAAMRELSSSYHHPFSACLDTKGVLMGVRLLQEFASPDGRTQQVSIETLISPIA